MYGEIDRGLIDALAGARAVVVLTGAGVSAESGIPTFRDAMEGMWARFDPMQLATPEGFVRDPEMVSRWYDSRRLECASCEPNPGHYVLARLERCVIEKGGGFTLLTQNVDGLHQAAGSINVVELHGSLREWRCVSCGACEEAPGVPFKEYPPRCGCGGMIRPGVVWFDEQLPEKALRVTERALENCDLYFSIGTSAVVYPAAGFIRAARAHGARIVEINSDATPVSGIVDWSLRGRSGEILPVLVNEACASD